MSSLFTRLLAWMCSYESHARTEYARILLPLAILAIIALWLVGRVTGDIQAIALSL